MADLLTLSELKERLGVQPADTRNDLELIRALSAASTSIVNYTERDFAAPQVTETRTYPYDGSGYLDIDDADAVTAVTVVANNYPDIVLTADEWVPQPTRRDDAPVFTYVLMPGIQGMVSSPEMGFTRNLDVYAAEGRWRSLPPTVRVTATWGWPEVPEDVKQATVWTVEEFRPKRGASGGERLQSEAIEGFARTWNRQQQAQALPNRARDLLSHYQRLNV